MIVEAGDALVMPQGIWHQVHSLEARNISVNLLFNRGQAETHLASKGATTDFPQICQLPPARRAAALTELTKRVEGVVANMVSPSCIAAVLTADYGTAGVNKGGGRLDEAVRVTQALLAKCLAQSAVSGKEGPPLPSAEEFVRRYFDRRRFEGLPLRFT